jgi:hypothetical protein
MAARYFVNFATDSRLEEYLGAIEVRESPRHNRPTRSIVKLLLLLAVGCFSVAGAPLQITVKVVNLAHVPAHLVKASEVSAGEIFRHAGVQLEWVDCDMPGACRGEPGATEVWLQLLQKRPAILRGDVVGFALLTREPLNDGGYAAIAWRAVRDLADSLKADPVPLLGAAIAHELGHVLLGSQQHSRNGIMTANLRSSQLAMAARGTLLFNDAQAEAIRGEVSRRNVR